jgi:ABC-type multidrug transport system permease subunit
MKSLLTLTEKDLRLLARDKMALFWVLVFPLIFGLFFGVIAGGGAGEKGKISIAVVDEDDSTTSQALINKLSEHESLEVMSAQSLQCDRIDEKTAANAARLGKVAAFIVLRKGFGESLIDFSGQGSPAIDLGCDPARKAESGLLQGIIMEAAYGLVGQQLTDPKQMGKQIDRAKEQLANAKDVSALQKATVQQFLGALNDFTQKIDRQEMGAGAAFGYNIRIKQLAIAADQNGPRSAFEITFPSAMLWAVLGCMTTFAVSMVVERRQGTLLRLRVAPLTRAQILAGKGAACYVASAFSAALILLIGIMVLHVRVSNAFYLIAAIACTAFCFMGVMVLVSMLGRTEQAVGGAASASMICMAMLGGGMIPLAFMPGWMQVVSNVSPVKWGIFALEGAIWRGFSLSEMLLPCGILLGIGVVAFALGVWRMTLLPDDA